MSTTTTIDFTFSEELNQSFLQTLYEGDILYASEVFDSFLTGTKAEFEELVKLYREKDIKKIRHKLHKIKPTFGFVGLTKLTEEIESAITACDTSSDISKTELVLSNILDKIKNIFPLIEVELKRMTAYIA
jgi:ribosome maturation protein Sdo1